MNLIEELGLEKCQAIVHGAPDWADIFCTSSDEYFITEGDEPKCCICLENLRTAIANHEKCQHEWNETTSNGDAYRFFVCKHCDSTRNYVPFEADHCTDIRNHISPLTGVIER